MLFIIIITVAPRRGGAEGDDLVEDEQRPMLYVLLAQGAHEGRLRRHDADPVRQQIDEDTGDFRGMLVENGQRPFRIAGTE